MILESYPIKITLKHNMFVTRRLIWHLAKDPSV